MNIPKDPVMLLSVINTALRDHYSSLTELCQANDLDEAAITQSLEAAGFTYIADINQFR